MSSINVLIYVDVISNKQSIFSSQIHTLSFPINWPSLVSTARSTIILWRLRSHKPSHKHDSNKYQSKAFVICDHKSDETRSVTHVNKAPRQFTHKRSFSKLWGLRARVSFFPLPLPRHSFFFCSLPSFLNKLTWKCLLRRLTYLISWYTSLAKQQKQKN